MNTTGVRFNQQAFQDRDNLTSRLDYDLNSTNNISAVIDYNYESNLRNDVDTYSVTPKVRQPARNVLYSGGWRSSPTANFSNEFRIGQFFSVPDFLRTDTIPSTYFVPTLISNPLVTFQQQGRRVKTFNLQNTSSFQISNHSLRFGGQFQKVDINAFNDAGAIPSYNLGLGTAGPNINSGAIATNAGSPALTPAQTATAQGLLALLGGTISSGGQSFNALTQTSGFVARAGTRRILQYKAYSIYGNDSWRVTPKLTINGGLRWDYYTPLLGLSGNYLEPKLNAGQTIQQAILDPNGTYQFIGGNAGKANAFYRPDKNNISFSASFAYAPGEFENSFLNTVFGKDGFVVRGGYRSSYVNDELVRAPENALIGNAGLSQGVNAINVNTGLTALNDRLGSPLTSIATPTIVNNRSYGLNNSAAFSFFGTVFAVDPNLQAPVQHDFQFGVQRTFGDFVLEARYVGGFSRNVLRTIDYNQFKIDAAYIADFNTVRNNIVAGCATQAICAGTTLFSATVTPALNSLLTNATVRNIFNTGQAAELLNFYFTNGLISTPNVSPVPAGDFRARFLPNPNTGVANVLENGGSYYYNSGQFELRRRFKNGVYFQANYTFAKELTDAVGTGQTRVEPFLDNARPELDYARADYDQTHVFNFNTIYELPFGKNRKYLNDNKFLDYLIGGWQLGAVWRVGSGAPITFTDARGTFNRSGRSGRQTALTTLSPSELKKLVGVYKTPCGVFFVNPSVINLNSNNLYGGVCGSINAGVPTGTTGGAASSGFGQPTFSSQVFFNNAPGQTSGLRRAIVNGPWTSAADISMLKNFRITESTKIQIRAEAFNITNSTFFVPGQFIDINSTTFGRITGTTGNRVMQVAARFEF